MRARRKEARDEWRRIRHGRPLGSWRRRRQRSRRHRRGGRRGRRRLGDEARRVRRRHGRCRRRHRCGGSLGDESGNDSLKHLVKVGRVVEALARVSRRPRAAAPPRGAWIRAANADRTHARTRRTHLPPSLPFSCWCVRVPSPSNRSRPPSARWSSADDVGDPRLHPLRLARAKSRRVRALLLGVPAKLPRCDTQSLKSFTPSLSAMADDVLAHRLNQAESRVRCCVASAPSCSPCPRNDARVEASLESDLLSLNARVDDKTDPRRSARARSLLPSPLLPPNESVCV